MHNSKITFDDNATVTFNATFGMTVISDSSSKIMAQGYFSVIFNDHSAKWCNNMCLPYTGHFGSTVIDIDGIVWCNNQRGIYCSSNKCQCNDLKDILRLHESTSKHININISDEVLQLSSLADFYYTCNVSIIGHNNPTVHCINGGRLQLSPTININNPYSCYIVIKGITWIGCGSSAAVLTLQDNYITIQKCSFKYSVGPPIFITSAVINIIDCKFENTQNKAYDVAAISCYVIGQQISNLVTIKNCLFYHNSIGTIIRIENDGKEYGKNTDIYLTNPIFSNNKGVSIEVKTCCNHRFTLHINGEVLFESNAAENGAGISVTDNTSNVIFGENSNTMFINNSANYNGGAMYLEDHSSAIFDSNSTVTFVNNKATNGIIYSKAETNVTFKGNCQAIFIGNSASQYGSAIYSTKNSHLIFTGNATVMLSNNRVMSSGEYIRQGGTIFSEHSSYISFEENSITMFNDNQADFGAAIYSIGNSCITFKSRSINSIIQ